jgi:hypothetical protein
LRRVSFSQIGDIKQRWNLFLLTEAVPAIYLHAIKEMAKIEGVKADLYYSKWPQAAESPWKIVVESFYDLISSTDELFFGNGNRLVSFQQAFFSDWNWPEEACITAFLKNSHIEVILLEAAQRFILNWLQESAKQIKVASPQLLRATLKKFLPRNNRIENLKLLHYCLSDRRYSDLQNVPLLPFVDGSFGTFSTQPLSQVFLSSNKRLQTLLKKEGGNFFDSSLPEELQQNDHDLYRGKRCT